MRKFHATAVEVYTEDDVLTVHFDDEGEHYLQLQSPEADDPDEHEAGFGGVYVEIDSQINSGLNCFSHAELDRRTFRLVLARDKNMVEIAEVEVTFDVDDEAFAELRRGLTRAFRSFPGFRATDA